MSAIKEHLREVEHPRSFEAGKPAELRPVVAELPPIVCSRLVLSDNAVRMASRVCQLLAEAQQMVLFMGLDRGDNGSSLCVDIAIATGVIEEGKVLLMDANAAAPQIHEILGTESSPGLCDVIEGKSSLDEAIRKTDIPNLDMLPIGTVPGLAAPLFASARFERTVQALRGRYRVIFVDGGTRQAPEAMVLGTAADAILVAIAAGRWRRADLQNLKREIAVLRARLLGVVLTDSKP